MDGVTMKAGVGRADIVFTDEMFPNLGENYTHVHDNPTVQVLLLEAGEKFIIAAFSLVSVCYPQKVRTEIAKIAGVDEDHVIVHGKHVLSTPHIGGRGGKEPTAADMIERGKHMAHVTLAAEEAEQYCKRDSLLAGAVLEAAKKAAELASENVQPAKIGFGLGYSETNVNRVVYTNKGWWQGNNSDGVTDRTVPVIRFDNMDDEPIAILFNCNTAPGVLENSFLSDGRRPVSGDIAGAAEHFIDGQYGKKAVSIYTTGATGDQWQALRALFESIDRCGSQTVTDLHEEGFLFVDILGKRLGQQVVKTAEDIKTAVFPGAIHLDFFKHSYPAQKVTVSENAGATTECKFIPNGEADAGYAIMQIGDIAIIFIGVEIGVRSYAEIKSQSPFAHTFVIEFSNVGAGGGYMVERDLYEKMAYQSRKSRYAAGTAELFCDDIIKSLKEVRARYEM